MMFFLNFLYLQGTMYGILLKLQEKIGKDKVKLGDPVVAIQHVCICRKIVCLLNQM